MADKKDDSFRKDLDYTAKRNKEMMERRKQDRAKEERRKIARKRGREIRENKRKELLDVHGEVDEFNNFDTGFSREEVEDWDNDRYEGRKFEDDSDTKRFDEDKRPKKFEKGKTKKLDDPKEKTKPFNPFKYKDVKGFLNDKVVDRMFNEEGKPKGLMKVIALGFFMMTGKKLSKKGLGTWQLNIVVGLVAFVFFLLFWLVSLMAVTLLFMSAVVVILIDDGEMLEGVSTDGIAVEDSEGGSAKGGVTMPDGARGKLLFPYNDRINSIAFAERCGVAGSGCRIHYGVDLDHHADRGVQGKGNVPVYPIAEGVVIQTVDTFNGTVLGKNWGNMVLIVHDAKDPETGLNYVSRMGHMAKGLKVKKGDRVYLDTVMGYQASTGSSTGSHMHLELYNGGEKNTSQKGGYILDALKYVSCNNEGQTYYELGGGKQTGTNSILKACYQYQLSVRGVEDVQ